MLISLVVPGFTRNDCIVHMNMMQCNIEKRGAVFVMTTPQRYKENANEIACKLSVSIVV